MSLEEIPFEEDTKNVHVSFKRLKKGGVPFFLKPFEYLPFKYIAYLQLLSNN